MNDGSSPVRPLRERLREQTEAAILDATERVLAREGLTGASMQAIAREAGVAVGTLYNRFDDCDGLLRSLVEARRAAARRLPERAGRRERRRCPSAPGCSAS